MPDLLAASDIGVLSSHEEGFSNILLENMAAGLPVLATSVGGTTEVVEDGKTGFLVPPENPAALTESLIRLAGDEGMRRDMGAARQGRDQGPP